MRELHFRVPRGPAERLDKVIVAELKRVGELRSRADVQRSIEEGLVTVDGEVVRASRKIAEGAEVNCRFVAAVSSALADPSVAISIVHEDEYLLVVDKPAGLVVHPSRGHESGTLVNGLLAVVRFGLEEGAHCDKLGLPRPGIVHRLDKGTSGLLVVAKLPWVRERLKEAFSRHDIERKYVAIVQGSARDATIDTPHGRHSTHRMRFTSFPRGPHRRAITHVRVLEQLAGASLVELTLTTGRTHQIRVHLSERMKTPILGDPLYGAVPRNRALQELAQQLGRQALHAATLGFAHPKTGRRVHWESPLPQDIATALHSLREAALRDLTTREPMARKPRRTTKP